jgi:hypothetical protein
MPSSGALQLCKGRCQAGLKGEMEAFEYMVHTPANRTEWEPIDLCIGSLRTVRCMGNARALHQAMHLQ